METLNKTTLIAVLALLMAMSTMMTACDTTTEDVAAVETTEDSDLYTALSSDLELSAEQSSRLRRVLAEQSPFDPEPGFLWTLADSLHSTLNARQIERLLNREFEGNRRFGLDRQGSGRRADDADRFRHGGRADGASLWSQIELTDDQEAAIKRVREASRERIEELVQQRRTGVITDEDFRTAMAEIRESTRESISGLLTEDQKAELESLRDAKRAEREQRRAEAREVRNRVLGLTDAQAASLDQITERLAGSGRALREQVRNGELTREQAREQIRANRAAADDRLESLLTDDQYEIVQIRRALRIHLAQGHRRFRGDAGS